MWDKRDTRRLSGAQRQFFSERLKKDLGELGYRV